MQYCIERNVIDLCCVLFLFTANNRSNRWKAHFIQFLVLLKAVRSGLKGKFCSIWLLNERAEKLCRIIGESEWNTARIRIGEASGNSKQGCVFCTMIYTMYIYDYNICSCAISFINCKFYLKIFFFSSIQRTPQALTKAWCFYRRVRVLETNSVHSSYRRHHS